LKLPRDLGSEQLAKALKKYGYRVTRQTGSHIRLTSTFKGREHHITIVSASLLKVGTTDGVLRDVASYLEIDKQRLLEILFS